ncbi:hypothetical protein DB32_005133 [Sandaracinus amylolyticus]|uniref:Uncharacterized protein n=1 Tax=Sandaracinus amylolyticus TaxID=927083 RepID=A0A0F6SG31_9BACT|nr:hypothetical protein DB32_005133 [Sandaracinus amylolyticus]
MHQRVIAWEAIERERRAIEFCALMLLGCPSARGGGSGG